jgi:hypothetical protein
MRGVIVLGMTLTIGSCLKLESSGLSGDMLVTGTWGGDNAGLILDDSIAHVHIGCTFGDFHAPITVHDDNNFSVSGSYMLHAYPIQVGPSVPAVLNGVVEGNTVTMTIMVNDTVEKKQVVLGPSKVTLGKDPKMGPCPICRSIADRKKKLL